MRDGDDMYIAVCDDNTHELKQLGDMLNQYISVHQAPIRFKSFLNAEHMLAEAKTERFTHYILDVMMPSMDGITAAQEIRSFDAGAVIIFLTSFKEYAYQGYRVKAYDYLLKPIDAGMINALLDELLAKRNASDEYLCIQNGRSIFRIPYAHLSYMEINQKRVYFYLSDGQVRQVYGTMAEFEKDLLARSDFMKIHRSYIVNLHQISALTPEGCVMLSGKNLPVSRLLYNHVRAAYVTHLFGHTEV